MGECLLPDLVNKREGGEERTALDWTGLDESDVVMSLPSYKRDPLGETESLRVGGSYLQPTPFRANQMMQQDKKMRGPLQRYQLPSPRIWEKYHRACAALAIGTFIFVYAGFKYDAYLEGEAI